MFNCALAESYLTCLHRTWKTPEWKESMKPDQDLFGKVCTDFADTGVADRSRRLPL
jgi:hypothetical protein